MAPTVRRTSFKEKLASANIKKKKKLQKKHTGSRRIINQNIPEIRYRGAKSHQSDKAWKHDICRWNWNKLKWQNSSIRIQKLEDSTKPMPIHAKTCINGNKYHAPKDWLKLLWLLKKSSTNSIKPQRILIQSWKQRENRKNATDFV